MRIPSRILTAILLCISASTGAQNLITTYSVEEGLPQSTVTELYRDSEGYLWCGTGSGLGIYDGWEFHRPRADAQNGNPNLNTIVRGIIPSADGKTVWAGSESVITQFDRFSYRVLRSFDVVKSAGTGEVPVYANDTAVWLACWSNGLFRVRIADGKITQLTKDGFIDQCGISGDQQCIVFPDATEHFVVYNLFTNQLRKIPVPPEFRGTTIKQLRALPGSAAEIIAATVKGMWKLDLAAGTFTPFLLGDARYDDRNMTFCAFDFHPDGSWWIAAQDKGIYRYDPVARTLRPCMWQQDGTYVGNLLSAPKSLVCDAYGVVWLGTDGAGLMKLLHNRVTFRSKFTSTFVTDTCNWFVRSFYELSPQRYLVGTYRNGLQLIDERAGTVTHVTSGTLWEQMTPLFITESGDGRLVAGTESAVLLIDTTTWTTQKAAATDIPGQRYTGYVRTQSGRLLIFGSSGLHELLPGNQPSLGEPIGQPANLRCGITLHDGRMLFASYYNGLEELTPDGSFAGFHPYESEVGIPNTSDIHGLYEDADGNIWLGSESGIYKLDARFHLVTTITTANGLSGNTIYDMKPVNDRVLALATGHGMTMYDMSTGKTEIYSGADGLPSEECNTGALLFSPSGFLYVGTTRGFVKWNPADVTQCFRAASILASYSGNETEASGIIREPVVRDYGSGTIELRLWITDFAFPDRALYTYRLDGADAEETVEPGLRKVNYAALGSGFYSFLCSADIPGCGATATGKLLSIKIVPPFWMSGWFIAVSGAGVVVLITLVLFMIIRMSYRRKLRKLHMQQELDKIRARISRDIHDEIGAGLTRIALSGELMSQKAADDVQHREKLKWIAGTARELSQSMKEVVWSVNPHYDSLDHMAAYFRSYVSGVAENADLRFRYVADESFPQLQVNPETRRNLLLILKEAVSNSVKYSGCTELKLEVHWKKEMLAIKISDNGKGFDVNRKEGVNSNGLRNMRQRAQAIGCTVVVTSAPAQGTIVSIDAPIA